MQNSRKSFRAYSLAQPIKQEIDETLIQVEMEKRKFLTMERQETYLKQNLDKKKRQLNDLKLKEPENKTFYNKSWQTELSINNVDRTYQNHINNIQILKTNIDLHRKQIDKYKKLNQNLLHDTNNYISKNNALMDRLEQKEIQNEKLKDEIIQFRELNFKNTMEFKQSHLNLNKSHHKEENQRKKFSVSQRSFLGEEMKNSKIIPSQNLSEQLKISGIRHDEGNHEILTNAVPLTKQRIKNIIAKNKQKLKITENYRKFGENLQQMFRVMKEYKGRDDIDFIAEQFVIKEKQLQKIEEYIGKIEARIMAYKNLLQERRHQDLQLKNQVEVKRENAEEVRNVEAQKQALAEINQLKEKEVETTKWLEKVSSILYPLTNESLNRGNAPELIGLIDEELNIRGADNDHKSTNSKVAQMPTIELNEKHAYNELLSYDKMRQFASDFVKGKRN